MRKMQTSQRMRCYDYPGKSNAKNHQSISSFALVVMEERPRYYRIGSSLPPLTKGQEKRDSGGNAQPTI
jgi:hypothetical protein